MRRPALVWGLRYMVLDNFRNLRIRTRIAAALMIPVLGLLVVCTTGLFEKYEITGDMGRLQSLSGLANRISAFVHELQKERGLSALYLGSGGKAMGPELAAQRQLADQRRAELTKFLAGFDAADAGHGVAGQIAAMTGKLAGLDGKRDEISKLAIPPQAGIGFLTETVEQSLKTISVIAIVSNDAVTTNAIASYLNFLYAEEKTGLERANGSAGIAAGKFDKETYQRFVGLGAEEQTYLTSFAATAAKDLTDFYAGTVKGEIVDEVARMRRIVLDGGLDGEMKGIDAPHWFAAMTGKIDLMKTVEDRIASRLEALAARGAAAAENAFLLTGLLMLALLGLSVFAGVEIVRGIARPIARLTTVMSRLAGGDKAVEIPGAQQRDEIGAMARAVLVFKDGMIEADRLARAEEAEREVKEKRAATLEDLTHRFEGSVGRLVGMLSSAATEMEATARSMNATADETNQRSVTVAAAAEQASGNVQTVASATEELSTSVGEIGRQVTQASRIAGHAVAEAKRTDSQVEALAAGARRIGDIVTLISGIASQTNLLALNATIEAARAGDAGKGFAVVASEVKSLATQTAKATEDITRQISEIQEATDQTVTAIRGIGATIAELNDIATAIAAAVEEQGAATQEIARNIQETSRGTAEVTENIARVKEASVSTGAAATEVLGAAGDLARQAEQLTGEVASFLTGVKAA
jgi:methyl-accepting chemotaxis protein